MGNKCFLGGVRFLSLNSKIYNGNILSLYLSHLCWSHYGDILVCNVSSVAVSMLALITIIDEKN